MNVKNYCNNNPIIIIIEFSFFCIFLQSFKNYKIIFVQINEKIKIFNNVHYFFDILKYHFFKRSN